MSTTNVTDEKLFERNLTRTVYLHCATHTLTQPFKLNSRIRLTGLDRLCLPVTLFTHCIFSTPSLPSLLLLLFAVVSLISCVYVSRCVVVCAPQPSSNIAHNSHGISHLAVYRLHSFTRLVVFSSSSSAFGVVAFYIYTRVR